MDQLITAFHVQVSGCSVGLEQVIERFTERVHAFTGCSACQKQIRPTSATAWREQGDRTLQITTCVFRALSTGTIGLGERDHVCCLHDPTFDPLELITGARDQQKDIEVRDVIHLQLVLSRTDRFHQDAIVACSIGTLTFELTLLSNLRMIVSAHRDSPVLKRPVAKKWQRPITTH